MLKHKQYNCLKSQSGAALVMLAALIALTASILIVRNMNQYSQYAEDQKDTFSALAEAKAALIAYAVSDKQGDTPPYSIGQLPCPENLALIGTSTEGTALTSCNTNSTRVGRLPWRTLGINQLKDSAGEPLWYALSNGFRSAPINSDTTPQLTLNGVANSAIAIVFSPGSALSGQARSAVSASSQPNVSNYLDQENANSDNVFVSGVSTSAFNDQIATITQDEFFHPLEKRVLSELKTNIATYKTTWHAYPFAVTNTNPKTLLATNFDGVLNESGGLLPVSDPLVTQATASTHTFTLVSGNGSCSANSTRVQCTQSIPSGNALSTWDGTAKLYFTNVAKGFVTSSVKISNFTTSSSSTTHSYIAPMSNTGRFSVVLGTLDKSLDPATGNGVLTIKFTISRTRRTTSSTTITVYLYYTDYPSASTWTGTTSWLMTNEWYRLIYYRLANSYLPNNSIVAPACASDCFSITKTLANGSSITTQNIPGVILMSGRALSGQNHSTGAITDYLDSTNNRAILTTAIFDEKSVLDSSFNDQIKALEP